MYLWVPYFCLLSAYLWFFVSICSSMWFSPCLVFFFWKKKDVSPSPLDAEDAIDGGGSFSHNQEAVFCVIVPPPSNHKFKIYVALFRKGYYCSYYYFRRFRLKTDSNQLPWSLVFWIFCRISSMCRCFIQKQDEVPRPCWRFHPVPHTTHPSDGVRPSICLFSCELPPPNNKAEFSLPKKKKTNQFLSPRLHPGEFAANVFLTNFRSSTLWHVTVFGWPTMGKICRKLSSSDFVK